MGTLVDVLLFTNMSKSSSILFLVVAASWLVCVQSEKISFGSCPTLATREDFTVEQYLGPWYENRKYCNIFQLGLRCVIANYTDNSDGTYGVTNSGLAILFNLPVSIDGTIQAVSNTTGELHVSFSGTENAPRLVIIWCSTLITLVILLFGAVPTTDYSILSFCGY